MDGKVVQPACRCLERRRVAETPEAVPVSDCATAISELPLPALLLQNRRLGMNYRLLGSNKLVTTEAPR
jgi:hypothetical protein